MTGETRGTYRKQTVSLGWEILRETQPSDDDGGDGDEGGLACSPAPVPRRGGGRGRGGQLARLLGDEGVAGEAGHVHGRGGRGGLAHQRR